jgi:hypothetical protein
VAQSGHLDRAEPCPLLGVKRTSTAANPMSAFDPKQTSANVNFKLRRQNGTLPALHPIGPWRQRIFISGKSLAVSRQLTRKLNFATWPKLLRKSERRFRVEERDHG